MGRRAVIKIMNLIYIAGAALAVTSLCTKPLVDFSFSTSVDSQIIVDAMTGNSSEKNEGENEEPGNKFVTKILVKNNVEEEDEFDFSKYLTKEAFDESVGEIKLEINVAIPASLCFDYQNPEALQTYLLDKEDGVLHNQIYNTVHTITPKFVDLVKSIAKNVAEDTIKDQVKEQISKYLSDEATQTVDEIFEEEGLGETVSALTDKIYDMFDTEEGDEPVTVENLVETILGDPSDTINKENPSEGDVSVYAILNQLSGDEIPGFDYDPDEVAEMGKEEIQQAMTDALSSIPGLTTENEDGELVITDIDEAILALLDMLSQGESDEGKTEEDKQEEQEEPQTKAFIMRAPSDEEPQEADSNKKFEDKFMEVFDNLIPASVWEADLTFGGYTSYILIGIIGLLALPWVLFALFTLIRTLRPKKCWTKPWFIFVFCFLQVILGVGLTFGLKFGLEALKGFAVGALGEGTEMFTSLLSTMNLSLTMSAFVPSLVYLAMIPFTIIYAIVCHKYKKDWKAEKLAKKAAK